MSSFVKEVRDLTDHDLDAMWRLHSAHFSNVDQETFRRDLEGKRWVVGHEDNRGALQGFTTLALHEFAQTPKPLRVFVSGDTIVAQGHQNTTRIHSLWLEHISRTMQEDPGYDSYWLLICSGYRTYRYMPVFWRSFVPSRLRTDPELEALKDTLAARIYGPCYDSQRGLVVFPKPQILKPGISPLGPARMKNPDVRHFARLNPRHQEGDELVCLTRLTAENQTPACRRIASLPSEHTTGSQHPLSIWVRSFRQAGTDFERALGRPVPTQEDLLTRILARNNGTRFGIRHGFSGIRSLEDYSRKVPLGTWDDMKDDVEAIRQGALGIRTADRVNLLMPTSGSTSARKLIPVTDSWLKEIRAGLGPWVSDMATRHPGIHAGTIYWSLSPQPSRDPQDGIVPISFEEDAVYLGHEMAQTLARSFAVSPEVCLAPDTEAFRYATAFDLLRAADLGFISIWHPSFLTILMGTIEDHWVRLVEDIRLGTCRPPQTSWTMARPPQEARALALASLEPSETRGIWPALALISCWADAGARAGAQELKLLFPHAAVEGKGLISTEGLVSLPWRGRHPLAVTSHVVELIGSDQLSVPLDRVQAGATYSIALTTSGGLYRHLTGDVVRVTGFTESTPEVSFVGRGNLVSDLRGEKLTDAFVAGLLTTIRGFSCLIPNENRNGYLLLHDGPQEIDIQSIERGLCENPHYAWCRRLGQLKPLVAKAVGQSQQRQLVDRALELGVAAGNVKIPHLITNMDTMDLLPTMDEVSAA